MIGLASLLKEIQGKPKAVFMAGPAGSGKSYISKQIIPTNFITINVDDTYEELLKSSGIGMNLTKMSPEQLKKTGELMSQARKATDIKLQNTIKDAKNIIIDSVGSSSKVILKKKQQLEELDYDTFMVMIYVSPITSLERNMSRERSLLPSIVIRSWRDVNKNIDTYKQMFGDNFVLVNNDPQQTKKEFDPQYIYQTFIKPLGQIGKEKTPEEKEKSKQQTKQLYLDIIQITKSQLKFDDLEKSKQKIINFINI
jgi:predicted kinase